MSSTAGIEYNEIQAHSSAEDRRANALVEGLFAVKVWALDRDNNQARRIKDPAGGLPSTTGASRSQNSNSKITLSRLRPRTKRGKL